LAFNGAVNVYLVILFAFLGAVTGDNIWYAVGRYGGIAFINRYGKFMLLTKHRIERASEYFEKHGRKTVFLSRFIFGTRFGSAALAGTFGMSRKRFVISNSIGAMTWVIITVLLGFFFGSSFHNLRRAVHGTEIALLILAAIALIIAIIRIAVTQLE
jgi:membrane protein DedA with SNARE-associated domain